MPFSASQGPFFALSKAPLSEIGLCRFWRGDGGEDFMYKTYSIFIMRLPYSVPSIDFAYPVISTYPYPATAFPACVPLNCTAPSQ